MRRTLTLLLKPVSSCCNMNCRYCFYHDVARHRQCANMGRMTQETARVLIDNALSYVGTGGTIHFVFQGGEPTLMGRYFFEYFTSYAAQNACRLHCTVTYAIQTNGLLLDNDFCKFFAEKGFLVGLSLDGPAEIHDFHRNDSAGQHTYSRVIQAASLLRRYSVPFNILCVVTNIHVRQAERLYQYFKQQGFQFVQFIPCIEPFGDEQQDVIPNPQEYGAFLCRMFDLWLQDWEQGQPLSIREFDNLASMVIYGQEPETCSMRGRCSMNIVVEADGSMYPCDFYVLDEWRLGNIYAVAFHELFYQEPMVRFIESSANLPERCLKCKLLRWCRGGCRRMREPWAGDKPSVFKWCEAQKLFIPYALEHMERLMKVLRYRQ